MKPIKKVQNTKTRVSTHYKRRSGSRVITALKLQAQLFNTSLLRLLQTPFTSAIAIIVMAIAIALAGSFYVVVNNAQQLTDSLQTGQQISLFLDEKISDDQARILAKKLQSNIAINKVNVISKQQALEEFREYSGFGATLDTLESNPLPAVIQVYPKDSLGQAYQIKHLVKQLQQEPAVDFAQIDMQWLARLQAMVQMTNSIALILTALLAVAVLFIVGNSIRSELQARRDEVIVIKLVGATNAFICLPFLYTGFWYGFISGLLAWCFISLILLVINTSVEQLAILYQSQFQIQFMSFSESIFLLVASSSFAILGALTVVSYQLRLLKPSI